MCDNCYPDGVVSIVKNANDIKQVLDRIKDDGTYDGPKFIGGIIDAKTGLLKDAIYVNEDFIQGVLASRALKKQMQETYEQVKAESKRKEQCIQQDTRDLPRYYTRNTADAARAENLENLKWLYSGNYPWDFQTFKNAAQTGNLEIMKWLHSAGCPWDRWTFEEAVRNENIDNLKWLHSVGCPMDEDAFSFAVLHGNLEIVKWLHSVGCPWNSFALAWAMERKHTDIICWLIDNGCPRNEKSIEYALKNGFVDLDDPGNNRLKRSRRFSAENLKK